MGPRAEERGLINKYSEWDAACAGPDDERRRRFEALCSDPIAARRQTHSITNLGSL